MDKSEKYNRVETTLSRFFNKAGYCSSKCKIFAENILIGCCLPHLSEHGTKEEIALREKKYGKRSSKKGVCGFHSSKGCRLKTGKPPICISYICSDYRKHLKNEFGIDFDEEGIHRMLVDAKYNWVTDSAIEEFEEMVERWIKKIDSKK